MAAFVRGDILPVTIAVSRQDNLPGRGQTNDDSQNGDKNKRGREPVTDSNVNGTEADDERLRAPQCDDHERGHEAQDAPSPPTTIRTSVRIRGKNGHRRERRRRTLAQASARRTRVHCGFGAEKQARMLRRPPKRRRTRDSFGEAHPRTLWRRTKDATASAAHPRLPQWRRT